MLTHFLELIFVLGFGAIAFFAIPFSMMDTMRNKHRRFFLLDQQYEPITVADIIERIRLQRSVVCTASAMMLCGLWLKYPYNWLGACTVGPLVFGVVHAILTKHDKLERFLSPPEEDADYLMKNQFNPNAQEIISRFPSSEFVNEEQFIRELVQFARYTEVELKSIIDVTFIDVGYVSKVTVQTEGGPITTYAIGGNTPYMIIQNLTPNNRAEALVVYIDELENWMRNVSLENGKCIGMPRLVPQNDWSELPYTHENRYVFNTRREYIRFSVLNKMSHECAQDSIKKLMTKNAIEPRADYLDTPPKLLNLDVH